MITTPNSYENTLLNNLSKVEVKAFHDLIHEYSFLDKEKDKNLTESLFLGADDNIETLLLKEIKIVLDTEKELSEHELNRYIFIVQKYIDKIKNKDPLKAQKLNSILINDYLHIEEINFLRKWKMIKNELFNLFSTWNYKEIRKRENPEALLSNFDIYSIYIESEIGNIEEMLSNSEIDKTDFILRINVIVDIFINLGICSFNYYTKKKIDKVWNKLLVLLEKYWLKEFHILVETSIYRNQLIKKEKSKQEISKNTNIKKINSVCDNLKLLNFPIKDRTQFLITKLEVLINNNWKQTEIESLIAELEKIEIKEINLEIHFDFLRILSKVSHKVNSIIPYIGKKVLESLQRKKIDKNTLLESDNINESLDLLIKKYNYIENKVLLLEPLFLLIEIEKDLEKREEYYFLAWWYIEKFFPNIENYFKDKLIKLWKKVFPWKDKESINDRYLRKRNEEKAAQDHKELPEYEDENYSEILLENLEDSLKNFFWIDELFIFNKWLDNHVTCKWFEANTHCWNEACSGNHCPLKEDSILNQLNEENWVNINFYENSIEWIINSSFFSEILVWKIVNIWWEKIIVLISKWRNNNTHFLRNELSRIERNYIKKYLEKIKMKDNKNEKLDLTKNNEKLEREKEVLIEELQIKHKELKNNHQLLEEQLSLKNTLSSMINHEFNNLHSIVTWFIEIAIDDIDAKQDIEIIKDNLNEVLKASLRLSKLRYMTQIMLESNASIDNMDLDINNIDLNKLLNELISFQELSSLYKEKGIKLRLSDTEPISLNSNEIILYFALFNIIWNSIKFSEDNWVVDINVTKNNDNIIISIKDDWIWIDKKDIPNLFKYRKQVGDEEKKKGWSWIWLYTAEQYINALGWYIEVETGEWVWTAFIITLPINN